LRRRPARSAAERSAIQATCYLFDGDQKPSASYIKKIKARQTGEPLPIAFLELPEIENYLPVNPH